MPIDRAAGDHRTNGRPAPAAMAPHAVSIERFADVDAVMARAATENFPVALRLLPRRLRRHLRAIYGYARLVDNLGDEYPGNRLVALDWLEKQLDDLYAGTPRHPVFCQLAPTVQAFGIPRDPFDGLLTANRLDQVKSSQATWAELLEYCKLSANPVGRLVLAVFEVSTPQHRAASDAVCSGLQVLEHLQDIGEDAAAGRIYLPADDMERFGCVPDDLFAPVAGEALRDLVAFEAERVREMIEAGRPLVRSLRGFSRLAIAGFVAGGLANLDAIEAAGFEVLGATRKAGAVRLIRRFAPLYLGAVLRPRAAR